MNHETENIIERKTSREQLIEFVDLYQSLDLEVFIDGGWCVDLLLGRQTREHGDIDIAMSHDDMPKLRNALSEAGFIHEDFPEKRESNFKMVHPDGRQVDFHTYRFNENGDNIYGIAYEKYHLTGEAEIDGRKVKCIDSRVLVDFHTQHKPDQKDYNDVKLLCQKFNIALPEMYKRFESK